MKMKLKRSPRTWSSSAEVETESDINDTEPLLSDASVTSRRSFGATIMFPDASETSDVDSSRPPVRQGRSPYFLQSISNVQKEVDPDIKRFQYYSKFKSFIERDDTSPVCPTENSSKQSSIVTIFAIWNTIMGSSLLTMPWGIQQAGLLTGIVLMLVMGAICLYTAYLLLRVEVNHGGNGVVEAPDLAGKLLGRNSENLAKVFSLIVLWGAVVVYWILMSNFLFHTVDYLYGEATGGTNWPDWKNKSGSEIVCPWNKSLVQNDIIEKKPSDQDSIYQAFWNLEYSVPLFLILLIGPIINFKSVTFFTKFNSFGTLSVLYLVTFVLVKSSKWGINVDFVNESSPVYVANFSWRFPSLTGMLALALFIHNIIITLMRNNRHQEKNGRDLSISFILVIFTYSLIGVVFYVTFPLNKRCIQDNLLNNFQNWDWMTVVARIFLFFQLVTVYPLIAYMLRAQVFSTVLKIDSPSTKQILLFNAAVVTTCILFAIFLPRIGTIIRFTGAFSGFVYIFTLPGLLHASSLYKRGQLTWIAIAVQLVIFLIGLLNLIAQFIVTDQELH